MVTVNPDSDNCVDFDSRCKLEFLFDKANKQKEDLVDNGNRENLIIERHSIILEEKVPNIGMEFDSHRQKDKRDMNVKCHRPETRKGCCAMMRINSRDVSKYIVVKFIVGHSGHDLQKQLDDPNFFYAIQFDEDDLIANILWVDAQMMADYAQFGDVIQTIVFGATLLYDETTSTFSWLFDTFVKAMSGKKSQTILTDQNTAMAKAFVMKWPETCHCLCIWHIYQNEAIHLSSTFACFASFSKDFSSCIYDYEEEKEFLQAWQEMLEKYGLQTNEWIERMFKIREKWALVYGRQTFCADLMTTQHSENINGVLKRYVSYKHNLLQFFHHFDRMIEVCRYQELKCDDPDLEPLSLSRNLYLWGGGSKKNSQFMMYSIYDQIHTHYKPQNSNTR
ncbi:hypothetical protein CDL12_16174 [Handroanthus impetiginosus]|uniref:Protein FAR1-RELATED SEQUENCE n=1 Tax=Handroanthus impetiginosus TaxID=429701 RepID=A0A2G9H1R2_9LAMI|nr:hypothetical protein CDL12_16174 [Handroanthus impetiginosus]